MLTNYTKRSKCHHNPYDLDFTSDSVHFLAQFGCARAPQTEDVVNGLDQSDRFIIQSSPVGFGLDWIRHLQTQRILDRTGLDWRNVQYVSHIWRIEAVSLNGNNPPSSIFFENIVNNFHNTVFHSLFRNTNYFTN